MLDPPPPPPPTAYTTVLLKGVEWKFWGLFYKNMKDIFNKDLSYITQVFVLHPFLRRPQILIPFIRHLSLIKSNLIQQQNLLSLSNKVQTIPFKVQWLTFAWILRQNQRNGNPLDTERKLNVHNTSSERLMYDQFTSYG